MRFKLVRWLPSFDFRKLSHLDGSLTQLVKGHKLNNGEAIVVTSKGWHRLRLIARLNDRAVMIIPETKGSALETLVEWATLSLRDGVTLLSEYREFKAA